MKCIFCSGKCIRYGFHKNGKQRYRCSNCKRCQCLDYTYSAHGKNLNKNIVLLLKEGCGIRSIARILRISPVTVMARIKKIAFLLKRPNQITKGKEYELDELRTFVQTKTNLYWIVYAIEKENRNVVDFRIGKRNKRTFKPVIDTLQLSEAKSISTDHYSVYKALINPLIHITSKYKINHIERKNLTMRTHLKRLTRRTICFSRSVAMLIACVKIYFWG